MVKEIKTIGLPLFHAQWCRHRAWGFTIKAATIARDWGQFIEFMLVCSKNNVKVVCTDRIEDAQSIFERIQQFAENYFEGSGNTCR